MLRQLMAKKTALLAAGFALLLAAAGGGLRSYKAADAGQAAPPAAHFPQSGEYPALWEEPVFLPEATAPAARELPAPEPMTPEPLPAGFVYTDEIPLSYELQDYTYRRCADRGLEYALILALMWRESGFQLDAVGYNDNGTRDNGVMQINDVNRGWLEERHGITDLMDPYQNIDAGTLILGEFTRKYGAEAALMAYQYGEEGMKRKHAEGVYTNDLIEKLFTKREELREILA